MSILTIIHGPVFVCSFVGTCVISCRLQLEEGVGSLHHLQCSISCPHDFPVLWDVLNYIKAVGVFFLHTRNRSYLSFLNRAVTCPYTAQIKLCVRRKCVFGTRSTVGRVLSELLHHVHRWEINHKEMRRSRRPFGPSCLCQYTRKEEVTRRYDRDV